MEKIIKIGKRLEALLENPEPDKLTQNKELSPFEISKDFDSLKPLARQLPDDAETRIAILFSKLALFFDAGLFFSKEGHDFFVSAMFIDGQNYALTQDKLKVSAQLPSVKPLQALRLKNLNFINALNIQALQSKPKLTWILVGPSHEHTFLLASHLADPWLKEHIEKAVEIIALNSNV